MGPHAITHRIGALAIATLLFWTPMTRRARADEAEPEPSAESVARDIARERVSHRDRVADRGRMAPEKSAPPVEERAEDAPASEAAPGSSQTSSAGGLIDKDKGSSLPTASGGAATVTSQAIALPKGEGSIQGMGESFTPNLSAGTGTYSVPLALPAGRAGVQPSLTLSYSTSGGDGSLGIGWSLAVPFISRQSDKGVPEYADKAAYHVAEDRFMYNGGQELVPVDSAKASALDGAEVPPELANWQQYRSRVEGAFMRFFRAPDSTRWVVQSKDGSRFDFGRLEDGTTSVESDPSGPQRIYSWQLLRMSDVHGASVHYRYVEDGGIQYLDSIYYTEPADCGAPMSSAERRTCSASLSSYAHRVHVVYESRPDVTSSHARTWRVEQAMRVKRIELTSAGAAAGTRYLVRRYHLRYDSGSYHSLLSEVQVEGRPSHAHPTFGLRTGDDTVSEASLGDAIVGEVLPPVRFGYAQPPRGGVPGFGGIDTTVHYSGASPDVSVQDGRVDFFDVNADGLSDVLVTDPARYAGGAGVYFNGFTAGKAGKAGDFSRGVRIDVPAALSNVLDLSSLNIVPMDVDGDGRSDLLHMPRRANYGYFVLGKVPTQPNAEYDPTGGWGFHYAKELLPSGVTDPRIDLGKDGLAIRTLDVNGDHLIDVVRTTGSSIQTWINLGRYPGGAGRFGSATLVGSTWALSTEPSESCLPVAGRTLDFADPSFRLADMNGDGFQDLVAVNRADLTWWPGRGLGVWGDGARDCKSGTASGREVRMGAVPDLGPELAGLHMMDVNADGAADLLQIGFDTFSVWFNRGGTSFTPRVIAEGTPPAVEVLDNIRILDIDGSTTDDVVFADGERYRWVDLMGGVKPRLLTRVENGLGALTTLEYSSSAVDYLRDLAAARCNPDDLDCFTWQREPLAPGATQAQCDAFVQQKAGTCAHRGFGSPVVSAVVRRVSTSDQLDAIGATVSSSEYQYHDAYYEGIEQEFRGFGAADAIELGDVHEPTSVTRTYFHQGQRPTSIAADRLADNPNEALKGREYLTEVRDERGVYLQSTHSTYAVRALLTGLNDKAISYAYVKTADEYRYDTALSAQQFLQHVPLPAVVRERATSGLLGVGPASAEQGDRPHAVAVRHDRYALLRTTIDQVDNAGNLLTQTNWGRGGRGEFGEPVNDERIIEQTRLVRVGSNGCSDSGWLWVAQQSWVEGIEAVPYNQTQHTFDDCGDVLATTRLAQLPGPGFSFVGGAGYAQTDSQELDSSRVDAWGQTLLNCGGADVHVAGVDACLEHSFRSYDPAYAQLVEAESTAVEGSGGAVHYLTTEGHWDRGAGQVLSVVDPNGYTTQMTYDGLARLTGVIPPNMEGCSGASVPTLRFEYSLQSPLSRVTTTEFLSCANNADPEEQIVSHSYVDGLGRERASLEQGETEGAAWHDQQGHAWVRAGVQLWTKKGNPYRSYQPEFFESSPEVSLNLVEEPAAPFTGAVYDAFGRPVIETNEDGSYRTRSYHALSNDLCDEGDNGFGGGCGVDFTGTCTTERTDGHERVIDQQQRQLTLDGVRENHRLFSYYRADGSVMRIVRARTLSNVLRPESGYSGLERYVERVFHHDRLGRRIASEDRDTDDPLQASLAQRTWRYLYNSLGNVAAVRDPRGCGQDFYFDLAGRLIGTFEVGCVEAQAGELASSEVPAGSVGVQRLSAPAAVHARYHFDAYPEWGETWLNGVSAVALGRATATEDRAQRSITGYDARGNEVVIAKQVALISDAGTLTGTTRPDGRPAFDATADSAGVASVRYDETHTYVQRTRYDHAGRVLQTRLPDDPDFTGGSPPRIEGRISYYRNGSVRRAELGVDASAGAGWHPLIDSLAYTQDGLPAQARYGDGFSTSRAATLSSWLYDVRRRPVEAVTVRAPAPGASGLSAVTKVLHQRLFWDGADNLVRVDDRRASEEWSDGHKPASQRVCHDALYRVAQIDYFYEGTSNGEDEAADWRERQALHQAADPLRRKAAPMLVDHDASTLPQRVMTLAYQHDFLANMTAWDDDARAFYERSIGVITNGSDVLGSNLRPSAVYLATQLSADQPGLSGWLEANYGRGGNLLGMTVHGQCGNAGQGQCSDEVREAEVLRAACTCAQEQHYVYRWDESNRLHEARRYDRTDGGAWNIGARQRYRYDGANQRVIEQNFDVEEGGYRAALDILPGDFERRGLISDGDSWQIASDAETQYLIAGARLVWKNRSRGSSLIDPDQRITLAITNLIQSTSAVIDLASGELLEAGGFYPHGAREELLTADTSVPLEPAGFTSKEADEEVGLTYFGERYLVQRIGRWATPDPAEIHALSGGEAVNAYHYVSGNLLQGRDPLGLCETPTECAQWVPHTSEYVRALQVPYEQDVRQGLLDNLDKAASVAEQVLDALKIDSRPIRFIHHLPKSIGAAIKGDFSTAYDEFQQSGGLRGSGGQKPSSSSGVATGSKKSSSPSKSSKPPLKPYEVGTHGGTKGRPSNGMERDHQPSHAANVKATENRLGRKLTPKEERKVYREGTVVATPVKKHRKDSRTFGGKNTPKQIAGDAKNRKVAARKDSEAMIRAADPKHKKAAKAAAKEVQRRVTK